ncbi:MAG: ribosome assembly RNA-binding protein YhbY [Deltaproteobacteria bacterium]|nr:MAG: ribosome assembly RNA-binding protein YhbY [Deltaproteobacteria bacterium]
MSELIELSARQAKYLKGLGHHLKPVVQIGKEGITEAVIKTVCAELKNRELIKVKLGQNCPVDKKKALVLLAEAAQAYPVQLIGKTILLYKPNLEKPRDKRIIIPG